MKKPPITIVCEKCNIIETLSRSSFNYRKRQGLPNWCKTCIKKAQSDTYKKRFANMTDDERKRLVDKVKLSMSEDVRQHISMKRKEYFKNMTDDEKNNYAQVRKDAYDNMSDEEKKHYAQVRKDAYDNMSDEEKLAHSQRTIKQLSSRTEEEWKIINQKNSEGLKHHWSKLSTKERIERTQPMIEATRQRWASMTSEEKTKWATKWLDDLSDEEREEVRQLNSNKMKEYNNSLSTDEKIKRVNHMNNINRNRSVTEKQEYFYKISQIKSNKTNIVPSITESIFINNMNQLNVNYNFQHANKVIGTDFYKVYTPDDNPYHIWDFIIHARSESILIDIDGSIHTIESGQFITRDGIDIGKNIQYRDSKRIYQTDMMNAYVILAYDDQLTDDTPVLVLSSNEIISYRQLESIISLINMSVKEFKKLKKI